MKQVLPPTWHGKASRSGTARRTKLDANWRKNLRTQVASDQKLRWNVKVGMPVFNLPEVDEDGDGSGK